MLLVEALWIELRRRPNGFFELKGKPEALGYANVVEWMNDQDLLDENNQASSKGLHYDIIPNPTIEGIYDPEDEFSSQEPRFNGEIEWSAVVLRKKKDDTYWLAMDVNMPEAMILAQLGANLDVVQ